MSSPPLAPGVEVRPVGAAAVALMLSCAMYLRRRQFNKEEATKPVRKSVVDTIDGDTVAKVAGKSGVRADGQDAPPLPPRPSDSIKPTAVVEVVDPVLKELKKQQIEMVENLPLAVPNVSSKEASIRLVMQRVNSARLLLDNKDRWEGIGRGLIVYVAMGKGAGDAEIKKAAKLIMSVPVMTNGVWGDGSKPESILKRIETVPCLDYHFDKNSVAKFSWKHRGHIELMVIPQASLFSKQKKSGHLQYRNQLEKSAGLDVYCKLLGEIERLAAVKALEGMFKTAPKAEEMYGSYDQRGVPLTRSDGVRITKEERKVLDATYNKAKAWVATGVAAAPAERWKLDMQSRNSPQFDKTLSRNEAANRPLVLCAGTFGNRQGLQTSADLGPFTHYFSL